MVGSSISVSPESQSEETETKLIEIITRFDPPRAALSRTCQPDPSVKTIRARNRIVEYLTSPTNSMKENNTKRAQRATQLAALAAGRAVTMFDYNWEMMRLPNDVPTGLQT